MDNIKESQSHKKKLHRIHIHNSEKISKTSHSNTKIIKHTKGKKLIISSSESESDSDNDSNNDSNIKQMVIKNRKKSILSSSDDDEKPNIKNEKVSIKKSTSKSILTDPVTLIDNRNNEMIFFDIETTGTANSEVIEFGAIIVDKFSYKEIKRYTRLIRPYGKISYHAGLVHNITYKMLNDKPRFKELAAEIYDLMHGRIWIGHSINSADIPILTKAFKAIDHAFPQESGRIDTLPLIRRKFGKRAGDLKMATLGKYFGLGIEKHRALDDSIMTFEVLKCISLSHMLECEMPLVFPIFVEETKQIDGNIKSIIRKSQSTKK